MSHANLRYAAIRVGNKGACLNFNLLGICSDTNCSYRNTKANASSKRIKEVKIKLELAIDAYATEGGISKKLNHPIKSRIPELEPKPTTPSKK